MYQSTRVPLSKILVKDPDKRQEFLSRLERYIRNMNTIMIQGYQFIRLYLLDLFHREQPLPKVDGKFCEDVLKIITFPNTDRKEDTQLSYLKEFYHSQFKPLIPPNLEINSKRLSSVCQGISTEMVTCLQTNISAHFSTRLKKVVRILIRSREEFQKLSKGQINRGASIVTNALWDRNEDKVKPALKDIYHYCLREFIPSEPYQKNLSYDLKAQTHKYFYLTLKMNNFLEQRGCRPFQPLSLRSSVVPKNIPIDTKSLIYLFDFSKTTTMTQEQMLKQYDTTEGLKDSLWGYYFNLENKVFRERKSFQFYYTIKTDTVGCSLMFIRTKYARCPKNKWAKKDQKIVSDELMKEYNSKERQKIDPDAQTRYLNSLSENKLKDLDGRHYVAIDPGLKNLIQVVDNQDNHLSYTQRQRYQETYTTKNRKIREKMKRNEGIHELEQDLNQCKSKTMNVEEFKKYITAKLQSLVTTHDHYRQEVYRKMNLRHFIHVKKSEDRLLNKIENIFGKDCVIFYGDWSRAKGFKGGAPVPGVGLRRKINQRFETYLVDEWGTSSRCYYDDKEIENKVVETQKKNKKTKKKIHRCLICHECCSLPNDNKVRFMNRDIMGALNILRVGTSYLQSRERPEALKRGRSQKEKPEVKQEDPFETVPRTVPKMVIKIIPRIKITI